MACVATKLSQTETYHVGTGAHATPVIADRGDGAWVVAVHSARVLALGDRFNFGGITWVVSRQSNAERGFVAHPLRARLRG